ncbi:MAG: alpha/beta fold hydrolase [Actinomycetota bacterium]
MSGPNLEHEPDLVAAFDGTLVAGRRMGSPEGTPILIAPGVGSSLAIWRRALAELVRKHSLVTWDLRGLHESGRPRTDRLDSAAHAEDAMAIANFYEIERFSLAAWSSGARIALEIAHSYPERVAMIVLVCGAYGYPITRVLRNLEAVALLPSLAGVAKHFSSYVGGLFRTFAARPELPGLVRQSGLVGPTADVSAMVDFIRDMASCDTELLLQIFEAVAGDPVPELLDEIEGPTLIVAGARDQFTPMAQVEDMTRLIPGSHLEIYDGATHYLPIEFPARLADDIERWLDQTLR